MQEKKTLPTSEPPPHPNTSTAEKGPQSTQGDDAVGNAVQGKVQTVPVKDAVPLPSVPPGSRAIKKLSKPLLALVLFVGVLVVLAVLLMKFWSSGTPTFLGTEGEIVWWGIQHDSAIYQPLIDEFERENPNIKIKYEKQSTADYQVRLMNALAAGRGPDIFEIHNTWVPTFRGNLSTLPGSVMSKEEFSQAFYPVVVSNLSLDKGVVGMPLEYDAITLFINEDVFASALKSPPETWSDVQTLSGELTQKGSDGKIIQGGIALGITENVDHWPEIFGLIMFQNGVNPARPTGTLAAQVFAFYKFFSGNKFWNNTLPSSTRAFSRGELAMYFGPSRRASEIIKTNPNLKFRTVRLPQLPKNNPTDPDYSYATYWFQGVSEKSKVKEGSWTFLKFLAREDSLAKLNEGIKRAETFGRVYPRPGMNVDFAQDQVFGSVVSLAFDARTWYLAGNTFDGPNGINTQVNGAFEKVIKGDGQLETLPQELGQILGKFGVGTR